MLLDPIRSLVDFSFYGEAAKRAPRRVVAYLLYVSFLFSAAATVALSLRAGPMLRETADWAAREFPPITVEKGRAVSRAPRPLRLEHPRLSWVAVMIDTKRAAPVTLEEMQEKKVSLYLTRDRLFIAPVEDRLEVYDLSKIDLPRPVLLDADFYRASASALARVLYPIVFLGTWALFFFWKLASTGVYGFLGSLINTAGSTGFDFGELLKIAAYAQTPVILLQAVRMFVRAPIAFFPLMCLLVGSVYLWQALRANARPVEPSGDA